MAGVVGRDFFHCSRSFAVWLANGIAKSFSATTASGTAYTTRLPTRASMFWSPVGAFSYETSIWLVGVVEEVAVVVVLLLLQHKDLITSLPM